MICTSEQGTDCDDNEKPTHSVTLSNFSIGKYEVTQAQWVSVMGSNPSNFNTCSDCPVEQVSWNDIQTFLTKLNTKTGKSFRLPTEAEWEYAARGGKKSNGYKYSGSNDIDSVAWYNGNSGRKTHVIGTTKKSNELGIYDMTGNVLEWVSDWYDSYTSSIQTNPIGPNTGSFRVLRGGSWSNFAVHTRVSIRITSSPSSRYSTYGFRLVLP
jgi:formylglycine-generating enzyme required for sulfatase activity